MKTNKRVLQNKLRTEKVCSHKSNSLKESCDFYCPNCGEPGYYGDETCPECGFDYTSERGPWSEMYEGASNKVSEAKKVLSIKIKEVRDRLEKYLKEEAPVEKDIGDVSKSGNGYWKKGFEIEGEGADTEVFRLKVGGEKIKQTPNELADTVIKSIAKELKDKEKDIYDDVIQADENPNFRQSKEDKTIVGVFVDGNENPVSAYQLSSMDSKIFEASKRRSRRS